MFNFIREYIKLLKLAKSYIGVFIIVILCMGISAVLECVTLGMIVPLSDRVLTSQKIIIPGGTPDFLVPLVEKLNSMDSLLMLNYMVIFMVVLFCVKGVFLFWQNFFMNVIGQGVVREVRNELYDKFQELSLDFYAKRRVGELMSRVTNDVAFITNSLSYGLRDLIYESIKIVFLAFIAFPLAVRISWQLSLFTIVIFPSVILPVVRIGRKIKKFTLETQNKMADLNSLLAETLQGAYIVKVFNRENYELDRFRLINQAYYKFMLKSIKRIIVLTPLTDFIGAIGGAVILGVVGRKVISGELSFGAFGLFLAALLSIISPIKKLANVHAINQQALVSSRRIYDIMEEEAKVKDIKGAWDIKGFRDEIKFDGVGFKYNEEDDFALENINLEVKKGESVALVGHSGAGKSTLVGLLPRLYDPQKGTIYIDGGDIREFSLKSLRSLIAVVSQEMVLFNATVRDNIGYGREGATEQEIIEAAKKANAFEFISKFPKKFDTVIGDRGFRLSGGEKQRIAIARAILKDAPILVLDEATSQLDSNSEQLIKEALYILLEGKTAFIIAHRLATVKKVNKIMVLDKGGIIESGSHSFLLERDTLYKKLYELQFSV